jgi:hypothetical protein
MFRYSLDGAFIDRGKWQQVCLESEHYWYVLRIVEQAIDEANGKLTEERASELVRHIDRILPRVDDIKSRARAL